MDLGKVTVFSGSPQQQSTQTLPSSLYLQLVLQLDDMSPAQPFLRSNGSGTNPTMKGAATPVSARQEGAPF